MEITKSEFEKVVSVATSAHMEVYEKVEPLFDDTYDDCKSSILGTVGTAAVEDGEHAELVKNVKRWVILQAFLSVIRQLDLVLTPTGFGVVSTQQQAPASKQRVDALVGQLYDSCLIAHGKLLTSLTAVSGWGSTFLAYKNIGTLYYDFSMMRERRGPDVSHVDWQHAQLHISEADELLRKKLSGVYMAELLDHVRTNSVTEADLPIILLCQDIIDLYDQRNEEMTQKMRRLLSYLDANLETYDTYKTFGYPVNHYENFQNTQDSPAYIFG